MEDQIKISINKTIDNIVAIAKSSALEDIEIDTDHCDAIEISIDAPMLRVFIHKKTQNIDIVFQYGASDLYENPHPSERYEYISYEEQYIVALQFLFKKIGIRPVIELDFDMCGGANHLIQFNNLNMYKNSYELILRTIIDNREAFLLNVFPGENYKNLLQDGLENFPEESTEYIEQKQILIAEVKSKYEQYLNLHKFQILNEIDVLYKRIENTENIGYVMINENKTVIIGLSTEEPKYLFSLLGSEPNSIIDGFYYGKNVFMAKSQEYNFAVPTKYIQMFDILEDILDISPVACKEYYTDGKKYLYIKNDIMWAVIMKVARKEEAINNEYRYLVESINSFSPFSPKKMNFSINWDSISYADFERLCRDLLEKLKFREVKNYGKANAADGGRDIEAYEIYDTIAGPEKKKWLFQCKHLNRSLNKKDLFGIRDLIEQYNVDAFGILCTSDFTPEAIDYLNSYNEKRISIIFWSGEDIERKLDQCPELITKYGLKINSVQPGTAK